MDTRLSARVADGAVAHVTAEDVMTVSVVTVAPHESLLSAWELLNRGGFRHLPVVGPDGRCVSLIEERTVIVELGQLALQPRRVVDIMPRRVHCTLPDTGVAEVARIMVSERVTAVPVIDVGHRLVGIVTDVDLVALIAGSR